MKKTEKILTKRKLKIMDTIVTLHAIGSDQITEYPIIIFKNEKGKHCIKCSCQAAGVSQLCRHIKSIIFQEDETEFIEDEKEIKKARKLFQNNELINNYLETLTFLDSEKREIEKKYKPLIKDIENKKKQANFSLCAMLGK